ncbi:MAG: IPT/TIG domain-containing protein, partial [Actinomycetota bacterium]|nr:IPT/TIG domain-containing protein [Actinomycetota bacterium]
MGMSHSHGSSRRGRVTGRRSTARVAGRRSIPRLAASALAAAALLSGLAVTGFAGVASATPGPLYATPNGRATSGCTSATASPCSLSGAISVAALSTGAVTITLKHSTGALCSSSDTCTFLGAQSLPSSSSEARLTIEGSGSSAYSVLNGDNAGTTFTDSATFPVTLENLKVTGDNHATDYGGGILNNGIMTVTDSTISGNTSIGPGGGGILNNGFMTVTDSTMSGNTATSGYGGGGIFNSGIMTVTDSTISGNTAPYGGGIFNYGGTMTVTDSTVSGNTATSGYGGIFNNSGGTMTVAGSIVAKQGGGGNCGGTVIDAGYNLSNDTSCGFGTGSPSPPGSKDSVPNLDLGTLGNYGGPTWTVPLKSGSAAIGAITSQAKASIGAGGASVELCSDTSYATASGYSANLALDQRGVSRLGTGCSAGAYQYVVAPPAPSAPVVSSVAPSSGPLGGATSVTITGTNLFNAAYVFFGSLAATS